MGTRVRVVVVDDTADVRDLLRMMFSFDDRFEVVGEAADGFEAIARAEQHQPDLMILDRDMPRLGGVEAIAKVREVAPRCGIVLFTAAADAGTYQAAVSAGALSVLPKTSLDDAFFDVLGKTLVDHVAHLEATLEVHVGPVPSSAAKVWITNTRSLIDSLREHPEVLDEPVPREVLELFSRFLDNWWSVAVENDEFSWHARAAPEDVRTLVEQWAVIDRMTDDQLAALGCTWSPPEGHPFFVALTSGVLTTLETHAATEELAAALRGKWAPAD